MKHELGHAVGGLWHEQQHPFASRYIFKGCDATADCDENCEEKGPYIATTSPYDPTSIMHYGLHACGGMLLNPLGVALAHSLDMDPMHIGAAVNYSIHDAQMVAREYSDERLNDGNDGTCKAQHLVQRCDDHTQCEPLSKLADGTCDEFFKCYYLDGGDCGPQSKNPYAEPEPSLALRPPRSHIVPRHRHHWDLGSYSSCARSHAHCCVCVLVLALMAGTSTNALFPIAASPPIAAVVCAQTIE